ncbi:glycosyltransferase family protein [Inediibacterium massiliense]|uniref:glycosyltransferase family protein n=1 Tax=Inediibacterium massiliense TaxID=1658111 RepID=UPI0006B53846|nr:glycosyltransferase [Inediibacterium massiliense]
MITPHYSIKVACILDEFGEEWFKYECNLIPLYLNNWKETLIHTQPDFLLVQSAWQGNHGQWKYKINNLHIKKDSSLKEVVYWCKKNNIPTVFWNIEDPYHFHSFIEAAKEFDYIFTTDSGSIKEYIKIVGHHHVYTLPFAAQPKQHNPIDKDKEKSGKVGFSGTWHKIGHTDRMKDMKKILEPSLKYNVHIYDRMYHYKKDPNYKFPHIYQSHIKEAVPYPQIGSIYKKYDVFLNVNTVQNSPTMFSCRVFEVLACGINLISGYSLGIEKMLPHIVKLCTTKEDTIKYLDLLLNNKDLRDRLSILGLRTILENHTYKHRFETILDKIKFPYEKIKKAGVSIITCTNRKHCMNNIFENYARQTYPYKELILILNNNHMNYDRWIKESKKYENVTIFQIDEQKTLGECLNFAISKSKFDYISKMDDDDYYAPNYMIDMMNAFVYTDADVVGKHAYYIYLPDYNILALKFPNTENQYTPFVAGSTLTFKKKVFEKIKFITHKPSGCDSEFLLDCKKNGFKIYSTDRFNYAGSRRANLEDHTWKITPDEFLRKCEIILYTKDYQTHITI